MRILVANVNYSNTVSAVEVPAGFDSGVAAAQHYYGATRNHWKQEVA